MTDARIGVIGLGNIGSSIGKLLLDNGFAVVGYDIRQEAVEELAGRGGKTAGSPREVAEACEVVITSLPSEAALEAVLDEVTPHLGGSVLIETSTLSPTAKTAAHDRVVAAGGQIVDCPLSGTAMQARKGDVIAYVSADEGVIDRVRPVIAGFTRASYEMGAYGTSTTMKLIANLLVAVHNVATAEALVLAQKAGLDLAAAVDVLADGAGGSRMLQVRGPMMAEGTYGEPGMNVGVFMKDIAIITDLAQKLGSPTPLLASITPIYASAMAQGWADSDTASVYAVLAAMANIEPTPRNEA